MLKLIRMNSLSLRRWCGNPLIKPRPGNFWEVGGTFNPAAFTLGIGSSCCIGRYLEVASLRWVSQ
ncbi:MAG: hypothetical protein RMH84_06645 [Sulfolobales archaeon]|nr:hypothetical protein [Sulfolobales archaeon]MDW8011249.1 hypothetical protein [Sulfolobales archaeon]